MDYQKISEKTTEHYVGTTERYRVVGNAEKENGQTRVYGDVFLESEEANSIGNFNYDSGATQCNIHADDFVMVATAINQFVTDMINGLPE